MDVSGRRRVVAARIVVAVELGFVAVGSALHIVARQSASSRWVGLFLTGITFAIVGFVIVSHRPKHRIGWLYIVGGGLSGWTFAAAGYFSAAAEINLPASHAIAWSGTWTWVISLGLIYCFAILLFPDGELPSKWWLPVALTAGVAMAVGTVAQGASTWGADMARGQPDADLQRIVAASLLVISACSFLAVCSLAFRLRTTPVSERPAGLWFAVVAATIAPALLGGVLHIDVLNEAEVVTVPALAVVTGIAIVRHRLWGIEVIVSRALVYLLVTITLALVYAAVAVGFTRLWRPSSAGLATLVAAGVIAGIFAPLRNRARLLVNRLLFGDREDPFSAVTKLADRMRGSFRPDRALRAVTETVVQALRVPAAGIDLSQPVGWTRMTTAGTEPPDGTGLISIPLRRNEETVGRLLVWPRTRGEPFSDGDVRLLETLGAQASLAADNARLDAALARSRERLVTTREEERRRIRRDLHDGLGSRLAGVVLGLQAARTMAARTDPELSELTASLIVDVQESIADVRRLIYELRPPALDELGFGRAIEEHARSLESLAKGSGQPLAIETIVPPCGRNEVSAAIEVTLYRVAIEALTNVVRHADARHCAVRLEFGDRAELEVIDDGRGLPADWRAGTGVSSMRDRVAELGGTVEISSSGATGTRVLASLPLVSDA